MSKVITDVFYTAFKTALPLTSSPLVQCITN
ncbi:MAG: hydroxyethylthiazole kinase, partial [Lacticaseibacillus paracasei]